MNKDQYKQLHPLELKVLAHYKSEEQISASDIVSSLQFMIGQANQVISWLAQKAFIVEVSSIQEVAYEVTALGQEWRNKGSPAERLLRLVSEKPYTMVEVVQALGIEQKDGGSAYGILAKNGNVSMDQDKKILIKNDTLPTSIVVCNTLLTHTEEILESNLSKEEIEIIHQYAKKRGSASAPFRKIERTVSTYALSEEGNAIAIQVKESGITGNEVGVVTQELLKTEAWRESTFREYNINLPPNRVSVGRRNPYSEFLQQAKDKLVGLGFEEFDGPLVETEFWNADALFMPQFHPARDIHDVYYIQDPQHAKEIPEPWLSNIADAHEHGGNTGSRGWNYKFDRDFTRRLILRSQGTVMSAKTLTNAKIPGKYFGMLRVFRHDQVDATHLSDFYQTEGIMIGDDVNIKTLLGLLKIFAEEFADAEEVKYVPGYFPFTEPSIEVHIKHPKIGWMELGGSGIFRPEVTKSLGIDVPVAAWGIGIDRMATMKMNINDIRDLFTNDLDQVSLRKGVTI